MKANRRVSFSPEPTFTTAAAAAAVKHSGAVKPGPKKNRVFIKVWIFKLPEGSKFSVGSFFKNIGEKMAKALPPLAAGRRRRCSRKVSSASLNRSRSYAETLDSQRAEAIEDCIEFLNNSSCLQRSNSVSSSN